MENEVDVNEQTDAVVVASDYNKGLTDAGTQTVFYENNPNSPVGETLASKPINENSGNDRYRNKLLYITNETFTNSVYVHALDPGSTTTDLISYNNGNFFAKQFVAAVPAGSATSTVYPAQATRVSGEGIWQNLPTILFTNGIPQTEADEIFLYKKHS